MHTMLYELLGRHFNLPDNVSYNDPSAPWQAQDEDEVDIELVEEALQTARHLEELLESIEDKRIWRIYPGLEDIITVLSELKLEN